MYKFSKNNMHYPVLLIMEKFLPSARTESLVIIEGKELCKYVKSLIYTLVLLNADYC